MIGLMLAGVAITLAEPISMESWLSAEDYPKGSERVAERGYVIYRLTVSPEGRVIQCDTQERSTIGLSVCRALQARATFTPARDSVGNPVFAIYENMQAFRVAGMNMPPRPTRVTSVLTLDRMPAGVSDPFDVKLGLLVDAAGKVTACRPLQDREQSNDAAIVLDRFACSEMALEPREPARDAQGKAVKSMQSMLVRFQAKVAERN